MPISPVSGGKNVNRELAENMFMCHVANLIDDEEFRLCIECAELFPLRQNHLFVCEASNNDSQEISKHQPERSFDIKKFCEFLNTAPDRIVRFTYT
jgi:hypothetical protein